MCWMYALCSPCYAIKLIQPSFPHFFSLVIRNLLRKEHWDEHTACLRSFVTTVEPVMHPRLVRSWIPKNWLVFARVLEAKMKSWTFLPKDRTNSMWIISAQVVYRENSWAWFSMSSALPPILFPSRPEQTPRWKSIPCLQQAEGEGCCGSGMRCHEAAWPWLSQ